MLQCCENPKIKIEESTGYLRCISCGYDEFQDRMYCEDSQVTGFSSGAYRHNDNLWSSGAYPLDNRKDVYQCANCKRLYTSKVKCCCESESLVKVIDASFIKYLNRWNRVQQRIEERNEEIKNSPHDCEKYNVEYETDSYFHYKLKEKRRFKYWICKWCGKRTNEFEK